MNDNCEINVVHKKFLKYALGVGKSTPNLAVMGDTGEIPLLFKGFRLMLIYWHRLHSLPNESLVKKALNENVQMRTSWIRTIEKLFNLFQITYSENTNTFKARTKHSVDQKYLKMWDHHLRHLDQPRLEFFKKIKNTFGYECYLDLKHFEIRKSITKLRSSSHPLEIEKGRHSNKPRNERLCPVCNLNEVETEKHFLTKCPTYNMLSEIYNLTEITNENDVMTRTPPNLLGHYTFEAFKYREMTIDILSSTKGHI